jgi:hypothetical protein
VCPQFPKKAPRIVTSRLKQRQYQVRRFTLFYVPTQEPDGDCYPKLSDAGERFLTHAIRRHGIPEKITMDKRGTNAAAIEHYNATHETSIEIRQIKYLNNLVEIVFTQLTKTHVLTPRMRRRHVMVVASSSTMSSGVF